MLNTVPQIFRFQDQEVRTFIDNSEIWFVAADVCKVLEVSNVSDAVSNLDDDEKGIVTTDTPGGPQNMLCVNEPGFYGIVLVSRKPQAKAFKRWLKHEVLPSIRKTGGYMGNEEELLKSQLGMMQFAQNVVQKIVDAVSKRWILDNPKRAPYAYIMLCYMRTLFHHAARSYEGAIELLHGKDCIPAIKGDVVKIVADIQNGKSTIQLQFPFDNDQ